MDQSDVAVPSNRLGLEMAVTLGDLQGLLRVILIALVGSAVRGLLLLHRAKTVRGQTWSVGWTGEEQTKHVPCRCHFHGCGFPGLTISVPSRGMRAGKETDLRCMKKASDYDPLSEGDEKLLGDGKQNGDDDDDEPKERVEMTRHVVRCMFVHATSDVRAAGGSPTLGSRSSHKRPYSNRHMGSCLVADKQHACFSP